MSLTPLPPIPCRKVHLWCIFFALLAMNGPLPAELNTGNQAAVVQTLDSAIQRINHYPADNAIVSRNTYPLDSDLSGG